MEMLLTGAFEAGHTDWHWQRAAPLTDTDRSIYGGLWKSFFVFGNQQLLFQKLAVRKSFFVMPSSGKFVVTEGNYCVPT